MFLEHVLLDNSCQTWLGVLSKPNVNEHIKLKGTIYENGTIYDDTIYNGTVYDNA
jgi:hypothetical protein